MRVLHICESVTGGIATYLNELVPCQIEKYGSDCVHLVVPHSQKEEISIPSQNLTYFDEVNRKSLVTQLRMLVSYQKDVKEFRPTVVHIHSTFAGFWFRLGLFFTLKRPYKVIYCSHGWAFDRECSEKTKKAIIFIEKLLSHKTDRIVCISKHDLQVAKKCGLNQNKLTLVKNTIKEVPVTLAAAEISQDTKNFLFVGRFDKQKGFDLLLEAIAATRSEDFRVYCIGDFVVNNDLKQLEMVSSDKRIIHLGWKPKLEVMQYMKACDALIMPSRWEGFGLVALEALNCGCPVFHSGKGGLSEHLDDCDYYKALSKPVALNLQHLLKYSTKFGLQKIRNNLVENYSNSYSIFDLTESLEKLYK
ncbi:hypothetical protein C6Y40_23760 [Alteromonas alba]|uniref:Glycosyl transferase n=1 Tax=Alteromonas alba TaxID=2079529 RepID=A0A2S9V3U2_9ALTE|nr:glycosyltransferase family 4 protein [Alteromonas alba]PRO71074.1 hypothetical protein C6Y40_23760 [Alteromonas alba]